MKHGTVSTPIGNNARYDCIWEYNGILYKIQIKTACFAKNGSFFIPFCNRRKSNSGNIRKPYTKEQVDFIATIVKGKVLLVKVDNSIVGSMSFRYDYPQNGIKKTINIWNDYFLEKVINEL